MRPKTDRWHSHLLELWEEADEELIGGSWDELALEALRGALDDLEERFGPDPDGWRWGHVHALEFPNRSFDVVCCLRLLMHAPDSRQSVAELYRVAERLVIVDYPSARSMATIEVVARRIRRSHDRALGGQGSAADQRRAQSPQGCACGRAG